MLGVRDGVTNHVLEEDLEDAARFFVDETGDTLHAAATSETTDCWLRDSLDVVAQNLAMTLCASFSETFASFATARHCTKIEDERVFALEE